MYQITQIPLTADSPPADSIVSTTLARTPHIKPVLFHFAPGQELSQHTSTHPAVLHFLSGEATVTLGEDSHPATAGTWIYMAPNLPHSITAQTAVLMLLEMLTVEKG
jgi:quercetin dioxygenase-like cupin family protein